MNRWLAVLLLTWALPVLSISERDAGVHDWHLSLIGRPWSMPGRRPRFYYPAGREQSHISSLIYTATEKNILAAVEPRLGNLVWRQRFPREQSILRYSLHGRNILALTGPGASQAHLFSAETGHAIWAVDQHAPESGLLPEPGSISADAVFASGDENADVFTLANGRIIRRIDGTSGSILWTYDFQVLRDPLLQVHAILPPAKSASIIHLLLVHRIPGSYALALALLSAKDGTLLSDATKVGGVAINSMQDILVLPPLPGTAESRIIVLEKSGDVKSIYVFADSSIKTAITFLHADKDNPFIALQSVDLEDTGLFVARRKDGTALVVFSDSDATLKAMHSFTDAHADAIYSGIVDRSGNAHVSRYYLSRVLGMASVATWTQGASEHSEAGTVFGSTFPYIPSKFGPLLYAVAEVAPRTSPALLLRMCTVSTAGAIQGFLSGGLQFSREEGLAHVSGGGLDSPAVAFLPVKQTKPSNVDVDFIDNPFVVFLEPHKLFPVIRQPIAALLRRIGISSSGDVAAPSTGSRDWLSIAFGYRKLAFIGSDLGKILAVDVGDGGKVLWEALLLPLSSTLTEGTQTVSWKKLALFSQQSQDTTLLTAVANVRDASNHIRSVTFHLDALTGKSWPTAPMEYTVADEAIEHIAMVPDLSGPSLITSTAGNTLHRIRLPLDPTRVADNTTSVGLSKLTILHLKSPSQLQGELVDVSANAASLHIQPVWRQAFGISERIVSLAYQSNGKVASMGRVLGDRSTLFKYLNPHAVAVAVMNDAANTVSLYVLDARTGNTVWSVDEAIAPGSGDFVSMSLQDNWLVYSIVDTAGGYSRIVSVELFSRLGNDLAEWPDAIAQSFVFPERITSLSTTQTSHGISSRALLVGTANGQLIAIPRRFLDPRRPTGKATKGDAEEMLLQYSPVIPIEPKWVFSHKLNVQGVEHILATPTALESTSQILALGLDMFGSSVSPSGRFDVLSEDFNKVQLVATTLGLMLAIGILKPIVRHEERGGTVVY